jgi:hypothetical protein
MDERRPMTGPTLRYNTPAPPEACDEISGGWPREALLRMNERFCGAGKAMARGQERAHHGASSASTGSDIPS